MLFLFIIFTVILALVLVVSAEHRADVSWMWRYSNHHGTPCCNESDCREAVVQLVGFEGDRTLVRVNGTLIDLPHQSVHVSETTRGYYCSGSPELPPDNLRTRCVFYAIGG